MKKHRKNKNAPPPGLPLDEKPPIEEHPKKQPFLKRLLFGEDKAETVEPAAEQPAEDTSAEDAAE